MGAMVSHITRLTIVYSTVCSGADQRKDQSSASLNFVRGIHRWPANSSHKGAVTRRMFQFNDVIMFYQQGYFIYLFILLSHLLVFNATAVPKYTIDTQLLSYQPIREDSRWLSAAYHGCETTGRIRLPDNRGWNTGTILILFWYLPLIHVPKRKQKQTKAVMLKRPWHKFKDIIKTVMTDTDNHNFTMVYTSCNNIMIIVWLEQCS